MLRAMATAARCALLFGFLGLGLGLTACDDDGGGGAVADQGIVDTDGGGGECGPGSEDCRCLMDGTCRLANLTCSAGICRDATTPCDPAEERCPPAEPRCYAPCNGDRVAEDGSVIVCGPDGLADGCLPGTSCTNGTCAADAVPNAQVVEPGLCSNGAQCPDFQVCLRGHCYSECEQSGECQGLPGNPRACERRVCREQCGAGEPCTDLNTFCDRGVCQPLVPPDPESTPPPTGAYDLDQTALTFTATDDTRALTVTNAGIGTIRVTVRKAEQITIGLDDTPTRLREGALPWLTLDGDRVPSIELELVGGASATVEIAGAADSGFARWSGRLEISGATLPTRLVRLVYSTGLTGRWTGTAFSFGNFGGGAETDAWTADRSNGEPAIPNAFMQVWAQYRNGDVNLAAMGAIVQSTLTGSWDQARVRELCRATGADDGTVCVPFNNADGVLAYTTSVDDNPIPSGVVQSTFSMEIAATDCETGACATGRIDSEVALQYPGDPEVRLAFAGATDACEREDAVQGCVTTLDGFDAEFVIGGRAQGACSAGVDQTTFTQPWLVTGFSAPGGGGDDGKTLVECRRTDGPFDSRDANARFIEANPVPDGKGRRRTLSLVDGLLIEQSIMVLLLRETVDPFHGAGTPLVSYQYVVLKREPADPRDLNTVGNPPLKICHIVPATTGERSVAG